MSMPRRPYLTSRAHAAFSLAYDLADERGHEVVTPVHVTLGILREGRSVAVELLYRGGVPLDVLQRELEESLPPARAPRTPAGARSWAASDERLLEQARVEADELGTEYYGCEHLLLAILRDPAGIPARVLERHGAAYDVARSEALHVFRTRPYSPGDQAAVEEFFDEAWRDTRFRFDPTGAHTDLRRIEEVYQGEGGVFMLLWGGGRVIGAIALRPLAPGVGEIKRFAVRPEERGRGHGRRLLRDAIAYARTLGYFRVRLDTIRYPGPALHLFERLGFVEIPRYNDNPDADLFLELDLTVPPR